MRGGAGRRVTRPGVVIIVVTEQTLFQFSTPTLLALVFGFYLATFVVTLIIGRKSENVDAYMVSTHRVGFGISAASMTATWVWAASCS